MAILFGVWIIYIRRLEAALSPVAFYFSFCFHFNLFFSFIATDFTESFCYQRQSVGHIQCFSGSVPCYIKHTKVFYAQRVLDRHYLSCLFVRSFARWLIHSRFRFSFPFSFFDFSFEWSFFFFFGFESPNTLMLPDTLCYEWMIHLGVREKFKILIIPLNNPKVVDNERMQLKHHRK